MSQHLRRILFLLAMLAPGASVPAQQKPFRIEEKTIGQLHVAMRSGTLTCRSLVKSYLDRIAAYDKRGPSINSLILVNPRALAIADSLDRRFASQGLTGSLHCIPIIVKDNFQTRDLQTTAGSLSLERWVPTRDATVVQRLRKAGAIILAKSNMAEWGFNGVETVSSILPGYTKNPYSLDRSAAGSSGGTAAAVAASFGTAGIGTDTGNSIRAPAAWQSLVGIRTTIGLSSRAGMIPLDVTSDVPGPLARTVSDAVAVLEAMAGTDREDEATRHAAAHRERDYRSFLVRGSLQHARIGVLRQAYDPANLDRGVAGVFNKALADLRARGATVVDSVFVASLDEIRRAPSPCNRFKYDLNHFFAARGETAPVRSVDAILATGNRYHPSIEMQLHLAQITDTVAMLRSCAAKELKRKSLRTAVLALMDSLNLDALVYPTTSIPPRVIGDLNSRLDGNTQIFSPWTGFPSMTVPMGWVNNERGGSPLPAGITFFGRAWSEGKLISLAYDYEQATQHRRAPRHTPPLMQTKGFVEETQRRVVF